MHVTSVARRAQEPARQNARVYKKRKVNALLAGYRNARYHAVNTIGGEANGRSVKEQIMTAVEPEPSHEISQKPILGSAEPLSPEETEERLRALAAWGVDLSLIRVSLELTPTERLQRMVEFLAIGAALHQRYMHITQAGPDSLQGQTSEKAPQR